MSSFAILLSLLLSFGSSASMLQTQVEPEQRVKESKVAKSESDYTSSIVITDITTP